jgi:ABC-type sugar transport system ATPase subunit
MLKASNIVQRYGSVTVLNDVNFELVAGEVHALFGANDLPPIGVPASFIKVLVG